MWTSYAVSAYGSGLGFGALPLIAVLVLHAGPAQVLATYRLEHTPKDRVARALSAWSISSSAAIAILSALGGLLAAATSPRTAIAVGGLLILASPLLLPRRQDSPLASDLPMAVARVQPQAAGASHEAK